MKFIQLLLAAAVFVFTSTASAVEISGVIKFGGDVDIDLTANTVDILGDDAVVIADPTGDFVSGGTSITTGDIAVYNDFTYDVFAPVDPLWTIDGFSFKLSHITYINEVIIGTTEYLNLAGTGILSGNGFDPTSGSWTFSADGSDGEFAFSSTNVPEPGIALLLGAGLIGFGISRKLRKTT